ncbi:unnamed protein product, partial [marine sediment metagenome]
MPTGRCYEDAWRFLMKEGEGFLVHGTVRLYEGGREVKHAWVELPTGWIWEPQTKSYFTLKDFEITCPIEEHRYTTEEAAIMLARVGKHGPWTTEERARWLHREQSAGGSSSNPEVKPPVVPEVTGIETIERFKPILVTRTLAPQAYEV